MARVIRRHSMERLELYDLDKLATISSQNYSLPPPLPPPRKLHRRSSINPPIERYQFLCNMTRIKTDPVYAATPMFTTIPQSSQEKPHRQLLGSYIRLENVKPLSDKTPETPDKTPKSPEPKKVEVIQKEEEEEEEEEENEDEDENDDDDDDKNQSGSSSSDEQGNKGGGDDDDDDDNKKGIIKQVNEGGGGDDDDDDKKKGIVEQIFNRNKKD